MNNNYLVGDHNTLSSLVKHYGPVKTGYIVKDFELKHDKKYVSNAFDFTSLMFDLVAKDQFFERYVRMYYPKTREDLQ